MSELHSTPRERPPSASTRAFGRVLARRSLERRSRSLRAPWLAIGTMEAVNRCTTLSVQRLFRRYDTDGSGTIDAREALGLIADMLAERSCRPLPSRAIARRSLRAVGLHRAEHAHVHVRAAAPRVVALAGPVTISVPCRAMPSLERRKGARRPAVLRPTPRARLTPSVRWTPTTTATSASRCGRPRLVPRPPRSWLTEALGSTAGLTSWHAFRAARSRSSVLHGLANCRLGTAPSMLRRAYLSVRFRRAGCGQEFLVYASARPELRCQLHVGSSLRDSRTARS